MPQHCQAWGKKDQNTGPPFPGATARDARGLDHQDTGSVERKQLLTHSTADQSSALHG